MFKNRTAAWNAIRNGYRECPMLIWGKAFEISDSTVPKPFLVSQAKAVQRPFSTSHDAGLCNMMMHALSSTTAANGDKDTAGRGECFFNERFTAAEEDKPSLRWFLTYMQLV